MEKPTLILLVGLLLAACQSTKSTSPTFQSNWHEQKGLSRNWAGASYWLNPLQAWKQEEGKLKVIASGGNRNCVWLGGTLQKAGAPFTTRVRVAQISGPALTTEEAVPSDQALTDGQAQGTLSETAWVGFQLGLKGAFGDYRDDAVHGKGFSLGLLKDGTLFIGSPENQSSPSTISLTEEVLLEVTTEASESRQVILSLTASAPNMEPITLSQPVDTSWLSGLIALSCSQTLPKKVALDQPRPSFTDVPGLGKKAGGDWFISFSNWTVDGLAIQALPERAFGPILWTQYTLSNDILKMSVQMPPLGNDNRNVELWVDGNLKTTAEIDAIGNNGLFRLEDWDSKVAHSYTVKYTNKQEEVFRYTGAIPAAMPTKQVKVASLSCVDDVGFPHDDLTQNVLAHNPDLYVFHGDQLYERVGGYGVERKSILDYQRKWYIFGWCFREMMRNKPVVIIPDDHDVFHGNLWGCGGKLADISLGYGYDSQDSGGYKESAEFVNMVHRTQTGHLPDPYDPTPVLNDISVYYTEMNYKGVSFAILGDRQWKSAPKPLLPDAEIENGWPQNKSWNAKTDAFHPEAELLGERQELFLENWAGEWDSGIKWKAVISQSPFCNVATLPKEIYHDKYVPGLPRYKKGEYPEDDRPVADFDSNGWPQNKRNKAVSIIRKAFALHFTGDQHLGSSGRYGVNEYGDAGYWISTPAVSNLWPRRWFPAAYGKDGKQEGQPRYTGKYEDGFGNKITVAAIANPYDIDRKPDRIFDKAPGYSIIEFNLEDRSLTMAVWPRWAAPNNTADNQPFEGWPIQIKQSDNYGRTPAGYLEEITVNGEELVRVINESTGMLEYALVPPKGVFKPFIFDTSVQYLVEKIEDGKVKETKTGRY